MNHEDLTLALRKLRLNAIADQFGEVAKQAENTKLTYEQFLGVLAQVEIAEKKRSKVERFIKDAKMPQQKELDGFDFKCRQGITRQNISRIMTGEWVRNAWNLVFYGGFGVGKSHLAMAIIRELCSQGYRCYFVNTHELITDLIKANSTLTLSAKLKSLDKYDLIVLDELGYTPHGRDGADLFFQFISQRYERKSLLITTNLTYSEWAQVFINPVMTQAAVDRIIHRCETYNIQGPSWRAEEAKTRTKKSGQKVEQETLEDGQILG
jgi:DNA replication protein DnaC